MYNVWGYNRPWLPRLLAKDVPLAEANAIKNHWHAQQIFSEISVKPIDGGCPVGYNGEVDYTSSEFKD
jgi:hypothetical protein